MQSACLATVFKPNYVKKYLSFIMISDLPKIKADTVLDLQHNSTPGLLNPHIPYLNRDRKSLKYPIGKVLKNEFKLFCY